MGNGDVSHDHRSSSATTPATPTSSSRRRTRPGRPTTPTARPTSTPRPTGKTETQARAFKISYNRPYRHPRPALGPRLPVQQRVPDAALPRAQRRRRHATRPTSTSSIGTSALTNHKAFLSVGHDEYWTLPERQQRRGGSRRRREPDVPVRQRGLLAHAHGRPASTVRRRPTARSSATRTAGRRRKLDPIGRGHRRRGATRRTARPTAATPRTRSPARCTCPTTPTWRSPCRRRRASRASGAAPRWASWRPAPRPALAPHTVGYESDEDVDNGARPAGLMRLSTTTGRDAAEGPERRRHHGGPRHDDAQPHALPRGQRRPRLRRRHDPVGLGARPDPRRRQQQRRPTRGCSRPP